MTSRLIPRHHAPSAAPAGHRSSGPLLRQLVLIVALVCSTAANALAQDAPAVCHDLVEASRGKDLSTAAKALARDPTKRATLMACLAQLAGKPAGSHAMGLAPASSDQARAVLAEEAKPADIPQDFKDAAKIAVHNCYNQTSPDSVLTRPECDNIEGGYVWSYLVINQGTLSCVDAKKRSERKQPDFRRGVENYYIYHAGDPNACMPPPPNRCRVSFWCSADYSSGLAFDPSANFGTGLGTGFGFDKIDNPTFQINVSIGARYFFLNDKLDLHAAIGFAKGGADTNKTAFLAIGGVGLFGGIASINLVTLQVMSNSLDDGYGLGIYLDATAFKELVDAVK